MGTKERARPRLLLMGCGAVGGVIAGGLLRAEHDLAIVTHNADIAAAIEGGGLRVTTPDGAWTGPGPCRPRPTSTWKRLRAASMSPTWP